jgi:glycosyltransferase involved in cell wall biosynthesis
MRVALIAPYHVTTYQGGGETYANQIARTLSSKYELVYFAINLEKSDTSFVKKFSLKKLISMKPDVIHTIGLIPQDLIVSYAYPDAINLFSFLGPSNAVNPIIKFFSKFHLQLIGSQSQFITILSMSQKKFFNSTYFDKLVHLPPTLTQAFLNAPKISTAIAQKKLNLKPDSYFLLIAKPDRHHYYKGINVALKALKQSPKNSRLIIVGEGNQKNKYLKLSRKLKITNRLVWYDRLDEKTLIYAYAAADALIAPSTSNSEGFGITIIEALCLARPVITTTVIGQAPVLSKLGLKLIPPKDPFALSKAMKNPHAPSKKLISYARNHTPSNFEKQLLKLYKRL